MAADESQFRDRPFVEQIASGLGFDRLSRALPGPAVYPPYLLLAALLVYDFGVVNTIFHLTIGPHIFVSTPTAVASIPGLALAVLGIRYMSDGYANALERLDLSDRTPGDDLSAFERAVSPRAKVAVYAVGAVLLTAHVLFYMAPMLVSVVGVPGLIHRIVIWNVYLLFVVEFALLYISVHVSLPRRLRAADVGLFYYDPENMGGFGPLGQLLKRSYYLYTAGLLLFLVITFGPVYLNSIGATAGTAAAGSGGIPASTTAFFTVAWVIGVLSIAHSMLAIHRLMDEEKQEHIAALEAELRDAIEEPYEITTAERADEERLNDIERRLDQVRSTRVYPASFTMWSQIAVSVLFPQALQLVLQATG